MDTEMTAKREKLKLSIQKAERTGWRLRNTVLVLRIGQYTPTRSVEQVLLNGMLADGKRVFYVPGELCNEQDADACRSFLFDWETIDILPYAQMNEQVRALGGYINSTFAYDAGVVSIPGSAISVTDAQNSDLFCYLLSHHIVPAAVICCLPARRYAEAQLDAISKELDNRYGYRSPFFVVSDRPLTAEDVAGSVPKHFSRCLCAEQMPVQPPVDGLFSIYELSPLVSRVLHVLAPSPARSSETDIKTAVLKAFHMNDLSELDEMCDIDKRARMLYAVCVYLYREYGLITTYDDAYLSNAHLEELIERAVRRHEQK